MIVQRIALNIEFGNCGERLQIRLGILCFDTLRHDAISPALQRRLFPDACFFKFGNMNLGKLSPFQPLLQISGQLLHMAHHTGQPMVQVFSPTRRV